MANILKISLSSYNLKENGERDFTMEEIKIVLETLGCKYEDIFSSKTVKKKHDEIKSML